MKTTWYIYVITGMMLCGTTHAQSVYEDDIYYDPTQKPVFQQKASASKTVTNKVYSATPSGRNVDEYNRRLGSESTTYEDISYVEDPNQMDTLETGQPFEYSERIRRFHNKKFNTHITDGAYLNIYVEDAGYTDVNIYYIDGYSNAWMSPFYYDSYYYPRNGWSLNNWYRNRWNVYYDPWTYTSWGYYDPWFSVRYHNNFWYDPWWGYAGYRPLYPYWYDPYAYGYYHGYYDGYYGGFYGGYYGQRSSNRVLSSSQRDFVSRVGSGLSSRSRTISGGRVLTSANSRTMLNSGGNRSAISGTRNVSTVNSNLSNSQTISRSSTLNSNQNVPAQSRSTQPSVYTRTTRSATVGTNSQVNTPTNGSSSTPTRSQTIGGTVTTPIREQTTSGNVTTPTRSQNTTVIRPASSSQTTTPSSTSSSRINSTSNTSTNYSTPSTTTRSSSTSTNSSSGNSSGSSSSSTSRTSTISGGRR